MKKGKLFLPTIIIVAAIVMTMVSVMIAGISLKPIVTEGEFPFSITYELDGQTVTIHDVYQVHYDADEAYKYRVYVGEIQNKEEDNTYYTLKTEENGRIELWTRFYADYLMGDPEYDYFDEEPFEPVIYYYDAQETESHDEETLAEHGVKLISFDYPEPIKNSLRFSHMVMPEAEVVLPSMIIAFLALIATLIFVKKDQDYVRKPINIITIVFNFIIGLIVLPFFTVIAGLLNALGDVGDVMNLITYLLPALTILGLTASIGLRRKLYGKSALAVQFISSAAFAIIMIIAYCLDLM
jgi:hypothetical protein